MFKRVNKIDALKLLNQYVFMLRGRYSSIKVSIANFGTQPLKFNYSNKLSFWTKIV